MLKKIIGTAGTRIMNALLGFGVVLLNSNFLGPEGVGTAGLILLGISLIMLVNGFFGGTALIYLAPRIPQKKLFLPAYSWGLLATGITTFILCFFSLIPLEYSKDVFLLSLLFSFTSVNQNMLLGRENIKVYNLLSISQHLSLFLALCAMFFLLGIRTVGSFVLALYIGYGVIFLLSFIAVFSFLQLSWPKDLGDVLKKIFRYGFFTQLANIIQLLNYRVGYYFVELFLGRGSLGIFTLGTQVSESVWHIGKSVATVQYSRISNSDDAEYNKRISILFLKMTALISLLLLIVMVCIPEPFLLDIFGDKFAGIRSVIILLSPGILFIAISMIFSHYYSGTGRHHHNTISSAIGLIFTFVLCLILVPDYGYRGAAAATSISYFSSMLYQLIVFFRLSGSSFADMMLKAADLRLISSELRMLLDKRRKQK